MPLVPQRPVHPAASPAEAMARGYFAQVRYLLELSGPAGADARDPASGRTPLILCTLVRDPCWAVSLARLLLEKGARVGLKDRRGLNALHYACAHGRDRLSELYLQAIDYRVNDTDGYRNTAMHYAVRSGRPAIVEALLAVLARFQLSVSLPNKEGVTPLMLAYMGGHLGIAQRLRAAGADAAAVDAFGKATTTYEREAVERRREDTEAAAAKAAGRRLRYDDIDGWRRYQTRLRSAPASGRGVSASSKSSSAATATTTFKESQQELRRTRMYQPDEAELICAASPLDRRNDPVEVFRATPADFFGPTAACQQHQQQLSINGVRVRDPPRQSSAVGVRPRARSAMPLGGSRRRIGAATNSGGFESDSSNDSDRSRDSREIKLLSAAARKKGSAASSGGAMAGLFRNYEYHCSSLYRPPPRAPDPTIYVQDFASRFLTPPQPADADGSDSTPVGRRRKDASGRKGKRSSAAVVAAAAIAAETVRKKASGAGGRISRAAFGRDD